MLKNTFDARAIKLANTYKGYILHKLKRSEEGLSLLNSELKSIPIIIMHIDL